MLNSGIIDLAIGLAFIFGATAAISSVITEMIARFLGLRGAYLLAGLRELVDSKDTSVVLSNALTDFENAQNLIQGTGDKTPPSSATGALLGSPILSSQGMTGNIATRTLTVQGMKVKAAAQKKANPWTTWSMRRSLPSYISSRSFAQAVIDLVVPDADGNTDMTGLEGRITAMTKEVPGKLGTLGSALSSLAVSAGGDIDRFRTSIENWYDDHMARVSGWYKRRTTLIIFIAGGILVLLLNINAITIGRALYSDSATRTAVSAVASQGNPCPPSSPDQQSCLAALEKRVSDAAQAGLPLGWGIVPACTVQGVKCGWLEQHGITTPGDGSWWQVFLAVLGFLATIVALAPGAQFWFGLVVKLNSLRSSGPPPASSTSSASSASSAG